MTRALYLMMFALAALVSVDDARAQLSDNDMFVAQDAADAAPLAADQQFGDCVVRTMPREAHEAVLSTFNNGRFNARYGDKMREECGAGTSAANENVAVVHLANPLRSILAASLVRARFAIAGPADFTSVPTLWHVAEIVPQYVSGGHRTERSFATRVSASHRFLSVYGECIARANPEAVRQLLFTQIGSDSERLHFNALQSEMMACLDSGSTMQIGTELVRQSLAYNYYRLASTAMQPVQESN